MTLHSNHLIGPPAKVQAILQQTPLGDRHAMRSVNSQPAFGGDEHEVSARKNLHNARPGDVVSVREKAKNQLHWQNLLKFINVISFNLV